MIQAAKSSFTPFPLPSSDSLDTAEKKARARREYAGRSRFQQAFGADAADLDCGDFTDAFQSELVRLLKARGITVDRNNLMRMHESLPQELKDYNYDDGVNKITTFLYDTDAAFQALYHRFIRECVRLHFPYPFYFQATTTIRVHCPGGKNADHYPRYHTDIGYGHPPQEINLWLPLTAPAAPQFHGFRRMDVEHSCRVLERFDYDFAPFIDKAVGDKPFNRTLDAFAPQVATPPGKVHAFDSRCIHTGEPMQGHTRISMDIRIIAVEDFEKLSPAIPRHRPPPHARRTRRRVSPAFIGAVMTAYSKPDSPLGGESKFQSCEATAEISVRGAKELPHPGPLPKGEGGVKLDAKFAILSAPVRHVMMIGTVWHLTRGGTKPGMQVLEIGSWYGASALSWAQGLAEHNGAQGTLTCVDGWTPFFDRSLHLVDVYVVMEQALADDTAYTTFRHNIATVPQSIRTQHMRGTSDAILPLLKDESFDVVFIDADHTYAPVKRDITNSLRLVRDGGIICGDDLNLQMDQVDREFAQKNKLIDFTKDPKTGKNFHPGVTMAVHEIFGNVSMWGGYWAMQKKGNGWAKFSLKEMPVIYPAHFPAEALQRARSHLADISPLE